MKEPSFAAAAASRAVHQRSLERSTLFVASFTAFIGPFLVSAVNVALPAIQAEFNVSAVTLSWIATSYLLSTAVFLVPAGKLADIFGRKKLFSLGLVILIIATGLSAIAPGVMSLISFRVLQGTGAAILSTTGMSMITSVFPAERRGRALGILVASVYVGLSIGPTAGGALTQHLGWRSIFYGVVPIGAGCLFITWRYLKQEWRGAAGERFDLSGSVLYGASLVAMIYGSSLLPSPRAWALVTVGAMGMAGFFFREKRDPYPLFDVRLFMDNRIFAFSSMAALIHYAATYAVTFMMSLYLQYIKGLSAQSAGMILVFQPIVMAGLSPFAGRLSDRVEPRILATTGMTLTAIALCRLVFLHPGASLLEIVSILLTLGLGFSLFSSPNMNAIMGSVEKRYYGIASGAVATMRLIGQMLSMAVTTMVFAWIIGSGHITAENHPAFLKSLRIVFTVFTLLCMTGIYFSVSRGRLRR